MRVLVTGSGGQLGTALCRMLAGETVIPKDLPEFDLTRPDSEAQVLDAEPDVIIHAGAYTDVDGAEHKPDVAMAVNRDGTDRVARVAARTGARLIYVSTDYVFDGTGSIPYTEADAPNPINVYGLSKWRGEQAVLDSGADALVVRTAWLYGHHGKNFVKSIIRAARREESLKVVNDQRGCPTSADDLASAIGVLMTKNVGGIIHVTNQGDCTWHEFAVAIVQEIGLPVPVVPITTEQAGRAAKRPRFSVLNQDRLLSLGIVMPKWRQSLAAFVTAQAEAGP
ncbi:dTDP-4-dehydrorhamnose reductase [Candidatus Nitrospira inopinata]|jgi:dTDP-4-dehydrorhamnose reductase|uniref:dTDP-4-dehydrorhamnose reductase n=1 Tax=Candidatus Nitrospira inopinata TaxID=1715989 RepID=A0A0S4KUI3_9BACT|nr:dTDP-4-dehydrorhamnose reductase [Candidatus Nitrospira inopinata]CUQ68055.1 dTDP-4-dehydrorhamnose reductase [Candidatus Nitrospira inopinata]